MAGLKLLNVGSGNVVPVDKIASIVRYRSIPVRRWVTEQEKKQMVIDATRGDAVRSVVVLESNQGVLSSFNVEQLAKEMSNGRTLSNSGDVSQSKR